MGARGEQNSYTALLETIYTISVDFVAQSTMLLLLWVVKLWTDADPSSSVDQLIQVLPSWAQPELGTDDMPDAYNGTPVAPSQACANFTAVFNVEDGCWMYSEQDGLGFGLASAVTNFCRLPNLSSAASRRIYGSLTASYFDDLPTIDISAARGSGQKATQQMLQFCGGGISPEKCFPLGVNRVFLGSMPQKTTGNIRNMYT